METTIGFKRILRDCPHNHAIETGESKEQRVYDWRIIINGEERALWYKAAYSRDYVLSDLNGESINGKDSYYPIKAMKAEFETTALDALALGLIPTRAEQFAEKYRRALRVVASYCESLHAGRERALAGRAQEMLQALNDLVYAEGVKQFDALQNANALIVWGYKQLEAREATRLSIAESYK